MRRTKALYDARVPRPNVVVNFAGSRWEHVARTAQRQLLPAASRLQAADQRTLARQIRIASIAAPTGAEALRAAALHSEFTLSGWCVRMDAVGNVLATLAPAHVDANAAPVVCLAHMDTVFSADVPLRHTIEERRVHCPGISDNGRGLAAMLALADVMPSPDVAPLLRRPIEFVATVGEEGEGNLRGARHYFDRRDGRGLTQPSAVVVLDGPGDTTIVHHAVGSVRLRVRITGEGGHSWVDYGMPNPVHALAAAASAIAKLGAHRRSAVAVTVSRMHGGESLTSIPREAYFDLDVRSTIATELARTESEVQRIVHSAVCEESDRRAPHARSQPDAALRAEITLLGGRPSGSLSATHPLVRVAETATRWQEREPVSAVASTDANVPLARGIPAITIGGGGGGGGAHTLDEWYDNTDGMRGVVRALSILVTMAASD